MTRLDTFADFPVDVRSRPHLLIETSVSIQVRSDYLLNHGRLTMLPIRFWLLASGALSIAGCQFPLFRDRVSSILQRENPDQVQREGGPRHGDNRVPEVSAELPVETSRQPRSEQLLSRGNQELAQGRLAEDDRLRRLADDAHR